MSIYKITKIEDNTIVDGIIVDPSDPLYELQEEYDVEIVRSNSSDAVYISRNRNDNGLRIRVGHPYKKGTHPIINYDRKRSIYTNKPITYDLVEEAIQKNFPKEN